MKLGMKLLALTVVLVGGQGKDCIFETQGATFDLTGLQALYPHAVKVEHQTRDAGDEPKPYRYHFGICENTNFGTEDAPLWFPDDKCHEESQADYRTAKGYDQKAPAWQVNVGEDGSVSECYRLGHTKADGEVDYEFTLLDPADNARGYEADPSEGFILKYTSGGDNSASGFENGCTDGRRDLYIEFQCDEDATGKLEDVMVFEEPSCVYRILFRSAFGCPAECPRVDGVPCGGNGVCGFNRHEKKSQCFCDEGYAGHTCSDDVGELNSKLEALTNGTSNGALMALLVIVFLLLAAVSAVLVYMCYKARRVLAHDKYVGLLGPLGDSGPVNDDGVGEKL